jgi:hypothetical protein
MKILVVDGEADVQPMFLSVSVKRLGMMNWNLPLHYRDLKP